MNLPALASVILLSAPVLAAEPAAPAQDKAAFEAELQRNMEAFEKNRDRDSPIPCGHPPMRPERISGEDLDFDPSLLAHLDEDQTTYTLRCTFKLDGKATRCMMFQPAVGLDAKNRERIKQWRFKPAMYKGQPNAVTCTVTGKLTPRPRG
ncbi:hypothetical protein [Comamonas sp. JC664]|uniref:hypothetical protein n=1 Tax=Comamonas sp. JC664 TaxID=2801917 RepID=UPI00174B0FE3|nr:hypothetical protein [Comamonas sp. JC664]MBL0698677.1 hypothetical protein [Comamonas sp. JC664]GHG78470.1 hypothetical protein GCM10012319_29030 [Comamonas sp. KCTC 72670]